METELLYGSMEDYCLKAAHVLVSQHVVLAVVVV